MGLHVHIFFSLFLIAMASTLVAMASKLIGTVVSPLELCLLNTFAAVLAFLAALWFDSFTVWNSGLDLSVSPRLDIQSRSCMSWSTSVS